MDNNMNNITYDNTYNNHHINTNKDNKNGCYIKALVKIDTILNNMIEKHNKIMIVRFDLRYPDNNSNKNNNENNSNDKNEYKNVNSDIYKFTYNLKRNLNREHINGGHCVDAKIIHVEEQNTSNNKHHHFAVIVNGNAKNKSYTILQLQIFQ